VIIHDEYVSEPFVETRRRPEYIDTLLVVSRRAGDLHFYSAGTLDDELANDKVLVERIVQHHVKAVDCALLPRAFGDVPPHPRLTWEI
jgi:hypothetical protein